MVVRLVTREVINELLAALAQRVNPYERFQGIDEDGVFPGYDRLSKTMDIGLGLTHEAVSHPRINSTDIEPRRYGPVRVTLVIASAFQAGLAAQLEGYIPPSAPGKVKLDFGIANGVAECGNLRIGLCTGSQDLVMSHARKGIERIPEEFDPGVER